MTTVMELASSAVRGVIVAPKGEKLVVADLSNIEGRVLAWLAGEDWKLDAFKRFDKAIAKEDKWALDVYNMSYAKVFRKKSADVIKPERQIGKVLELAFGYQGGLGACITFAEAYGINLEDKAKEIIDHLPPHILDESRNFLTWQREQKNSQYNLSDDAFVTWDSVKRIWRNEHPATQSYWAQLQLATIEAVQNPGTTYRIRKHAIRCVGAWLRISLPSGRCLCYPNPLIKDGKLTYLGLNQFSRKWERLSTYGGKLVENITQAVARDVMADGMLRIDKHLDLSESGYKIVLTVHDEIIAEAPDTKECSSEELAKMMSTTPEWAEGLPLAAAGFECYRYRKD